MKIRTSFLRYRKLPLCIVVAFVFIASLASRPSFAQGTQGDPCMLKMGTLPSIFFQSNSAKLLADSKKILETIATKLRNNPSCRIVVTGYGNNSKKTQQMGWLHVNTVISYLVEKEGIASDRFIFQYGQSGPPTKTDFRVAAPGEEGPNRVPPPFPGMK